MSDWDSWWKSKRIDGKLFQFVKKMTTADKVRMISRMLRGLIPDAPEILELGAGSGMTTVSLVRKLGGRGVLVDAAPEARKFFRYMYGDPSAVTYHVADVTRFTTEERFDLVFSDGVVSLLRGDLLEQFMNKHGVFLKPQGLVLIILARDSCYIRMRDRLLGSDLFYQVFLRWFGISRPSYEYEKLYTDTDAAALCTGHGLEVCTITNTYKTVCILCRKSQAQD